MADEITLVDYIGGGRIAATLSELLHVNLYDMANLRALMTFYRYRGGGSATQNVTTVTPDNAMTAATSEVLGGFANSPLTTSQFQLTVARYGLRMQPSDLFKITEPGSPIDVEYIVSVLVQSFGLTMTDLLTGLFPNISGNVGTSGAALTVDDYYDGIFTLNLANNSTNIVSVLHNVQVNHLMASIRGETGPLEYRGDIQNAAAAGVIRNTTTGFRFSFANTDVYQSDSVPTANAAVDRQGCMFTPQAFAYTLGDVADMDPMINPQNMIVSTQEMFVERDRDAANALTALFANAYPGVAEAEDARGVKVTTSAT